MKKKYYLVTYFEFLAICTRGKKDSGGEWFDIVKIIKHDKNLPHYSGGDHSPKSFPNVTDTFKIVSKHESFDEAMEGVLLEIL